VADLLLSVATVTLFVLFLYTPLISEDPALTSRRDLSLRPVNPALSKCKLKLAISTSLGLPVCPQLKGIINPTSSSNGSLTDLKTAF